MSKQQLILNGIFYFFLTAFFIYIFVNEKKLVEKIRLYRDKFSDFLIKVLNIRSKFLAKYVRKFVNLTEAIGTALILVLIIQRFYLGNFLVPTGSMIPTIMPKDRLFGNMVIYKFRKPEREEIIVFKEPIQDKVLYTKRVMGLPGEEVHISDGYLYVENKKITTRGYSDLGDIGGNTWRIPKKGDVIEIIPGMNYNSEYKARNIDVAEVQKYLMENPGYVEELLPNVEFRVNGVKTGKVLELIHNKENIDKLMKGEIIKVVSPVDYYFVLGDNTEGSYDSRMWGFVSEDKIRGKAFVRFWPLNRIGLLN